MSASAIDDLWQANLAEVFGTYKQERMGPEMYEHFVTPGYFPELKARTPCVVVGSRGTGKTTALWGLSYEGAHLRSGGDPAFLEGSEIIGLFLRCDRSVAQAFSGESRPREEWTKLFTHYINLALAEQVLRFCVWADEHQLTTSASIPEEAIERMYGALGLDASELELDVSGAHAITRKLINELELAVNNNRDPETLSVLGRPFEPLVESLNRSSEGKSVAFLLDEYESLSGTQQQVVNTLVKNAETIYTVKIAVRELGFHSRDVVGRGEPLISPADYTLIDLGRRLSGSRFSQFALDVVEARIGEFNRRIDGHGPPLPPVTSILPGLSIAEEAARLGAGQVAASIRSELADVALTSVGERFVASSSDLELVVLKYLAASDGYPLERAVDEAASNAKRWNNRLVNYGYASLFTLKAQRAVSIRKYYAGWDTYVLMAAGNVRFLLLLLANCLRIAANSGDLADSRSVSPELQTQAAQEVGREHLVEIRDIDMVGSDLLRFALGLGRLFETMARDPYGHTPEVNEFYLSPGDLDDLGHSEQVRLEELLRAAVQHSVVMRIPSTKRRDALTTREDDYQLHPILSAAFVFTHRRKRKILLRPTDLLGLVDDHRTTLKQVLARTGRELPDDMDFLPNQLSLFEAYFVDSDQGRS